jgi:hypothetical protein
VRWYPRSWYSAVAVWREVLVPAAVLLRLPGFYQESWNYLLTGDVGFCAALIATLGLTTLTARVVNGLRPPRASACGETPSHDGRTPTEELATVKSGPAADSDDSPGYS